MRKRQFSHHLGIIIPSAIILFNGFAAWYAVIRFDPYEIKRNFLLAYAYVWLTYYLAIKVPPGYADGLIVKDPNAMYVTCMKCHKPKPERAHHCRVCNRCVLRMDHHCPWTENCVGYANTGHFLRFVGSASALCAYGLYRHVMFFKFVLRYRRHLVRVCPQKSRIYISILGVIGDFVICLTLSILWIRVVLDVLQNQTQIEGWEKERAAILARRKLATKQEFPFDVGFYRNWVLTVGPLYSLLWPNGGPPKVGLNGAGHVFPKFVEKDKRWPPVDSKEVNDHEYYRLDRWINFEGDSLGDFGVDPEADKS